MPFTILTDLPITPLAHNFDACGVRSTPADPYEVLLARLRREHVPFTIFWVLTRVCNPACVMCNHVPQDRPELSTAECLDVLEQLAAAGTPRLTLTGGEILIRRDFFTITTQAQARGFAHDLKASGTRFTPKLADRVAALATIQVDISLLDATDATFDAVAGSKGTPRRALRGVCLLDAGHTLACSHAQARFADQFPGAPILKTPVQVLLTGERRLAGGRQGKPGSRRYRTAEHRPVCPIVRLASFTADHETKPRWFRCQPTPRWRVL